jgi:ActR/RegA family two-component response regulator
MGSRLCRDHRGGVAEGKARAKEAPPAYAVVDLKLDDGNGLMWWRPCTSCVPTAASSC